MIEIRDTFRGGEDAEIETGRPMGMGCPLLIILGT